MNQAIQFPDRESWLAEFDAVAFPALVNGFQVTCAIKRDALQARYPQDASEQVLSVFRSHRWDLEEEAEALIRQNEEDDQGWYWLS